MSYYYSLVSDDLDIHTYYRTPVLIHYRCNSEDFVNYFNNNLCDQLFRNEPELHQMVKKLLSGIRMGINKNVERFGKKIRLFETHVAFELFTNIVPDATLILLALGHSNDGTVKPYSIRFYKLIYNEKEMYIIMPVFYCGINDKFVQMDTHTRERLRIIIDENCSTLQNKLCREISLNLMYKLSTLRYFMNREEALHNLGAICRYWRINMRFIKE